MELWGGSPVATNDEKYALRVALDDAIIMLKPSQYALNQEFMAVVSIVDPRSGVWEWIVRVPWEEVQTPQDLVDALNSYAPPHSFLQQPGGPPPINPIDYVKSTVNATNNIRISWVYGLLNRDYCGWVQPLNLFTSDVLNVGLRHEFWTNAGPNREFDFSIQNALEEDDISHIDIKMPGFIEEPWTRGCTLYTLPVKPEYMDKLHVYKPNNFTFVPVIDGVFTHAPVQLEAVSVNGSRHINNVQEAELGLVFERVLRCGLQPPAVRTCHIHT